MRSHARLQDVAAQDSTAAGDADLAQDTTAAPDAGAAQDTDVLTAQEDQSTS